MVADGSSTRAARSTSSRRPSPSARTGPRSADYGRYTAASAMVETADRLTEDEASSSSTCCWSARSVRSRAASTRQPHPRLVPAALVRDCRLGAQLPRLRRCGAPGPHSAFVVQLGGVVCRAGAPPGAPRAGPETLVAAPRSSPGTGDAEAADERTRSQASGIVAAYAQYHLERELRPSKHVDRELRPPQRARSPTPTATPYDYQPIDWTGLYPPDARKSSCPSMSPSSWTATAGGRTGGA